MGKLDTQPPSKEYESKELCSRCKNIVSDWYRVEFIPTKFKISYDGSFAVKETCYLCLVCQALFRTWLHAGGEEEELGEEAKVTFYEGGTGVITNDTSPRVQFAYNFSEGSEAGLN